LQYGLLQAGTILALGWLITQLSAWVVQIHDSIAWVMVRQFYWMPLVNQWGYLDEPPITLLVVGLAIAFVGTPWLWDAWLIKRCQAKPLRVLELANQKPETTRLLQRHCRQARLPLPRLRLLPDAVPIIFSYGCLPQQARIVISQGLLDQLDDAALAGMMAGELSRILRWDFTVMSWGVLILQIPYGIYRVGADCANRWTLPVSRWLAVGTSVIGYGLFRLLRWPLLPLARKRTWLGDRYAVNLTGNPNGIAQGWLNWVTAWAGAIAQTGHIPTRLEAWELLLPLSVESAITIGSCAPHSPLEPILRWEHTNPYRHWLALNQSHPTWGDRLAALMHLAQRWKLDPAWDLQDDTARALARQYLPTWPEQRRCLPPAATTLWLQAAPYLGAILGMAIALFLWIPGAASIALSQRALSWMYGDPSLILGLACVGASLGIFWRINAFFPDIRWENLPVLGSPELPLASGLVDANALPVNPMPVRLKGRLLGRSPWLGALGQGWLLETPTGTIALHWQHPWGPLGKLWVCEKQRNSLLGRQVVVTGWLRRGATPWIDVDLLNRATVSDQSLARTSQTRVNGHPLWSTTGAILTALLGILVLYAGL
jgi:Zn-dependent protease with chaperone function